MAFVKGTATDYKNLLAQLVQIVTSDQVATVAVNAGGTGYAVDDILTVAGGTSTHAATLRVTSVSSGVINGIKVEQSGAYTADPTLTGNSVTGGSGSGATMDLTMQTAEWTAERNTVSTETEVILRGDGSGSDNIYVGIRTFQDAGVSAYNWELAGFTGFDSGLTWNNQPGISHGRYDDGNTLTEGGAFVLLDNASITFWITHSGRRILGVAKVAGTYESFYLGFLDTFSTTTEAVYPLCIAGSCSQKNTRFNSTRACHTSIIDPRAKATATSPTTSGASMMFRMTDGYWYDVYNARENSGVATTAMTAQEVNNVSPTGDMAYSPPNTTPTADNISNLGAFEWNQFKKPDNSTPNYELRPTPGSSNATPFFPCLVMLTSPSEQFPGELAGVFWFSKAGTSIVPEDEFVIGTDRYLIFSAANNTNNWDYFCIKKE